MLHFTRFSRQRSIVKVFGKQRLRTTSKEVKAIRTAGSAAELIELKAQFYKLVTINHNCTNHVQTCEMSI